jgi:hypothetical protein
MNAEETMTGSNEDKPSQPPKAEDWSPMNVIGRTYDSLPALQHRPAHPENFKVPEEAAAIDFKPKGYRSYRGILLVILFLTIGAVLYFSFMNYPSMEPIARRPMIYSSVDKIGKPVDLVMKKLKTRLHRFESTPAGAHVILNGNVLSGVTPMSAPVNVGVPSTARFVLAGHASIVALITPDNSAKPVELSAAQTPMAKLSLESRPEGVMVSLDGVPLGKTPLVDVDVPALGASAIQLSAPKYHTHTLLTELKPGRPHKHGVQLKPAITPPTLTRVTVTSEPENATVERQDRDGVWKQVGKTGDSGLILKQPIGMFIRFRLSLDGHKGVEHVIDAKGPHYTVEFELVALADERGALKLEGSKDLLVFLNGDELDGLPHDAAGVPSGSYKLVIVDTKTRKRVKKTIMVVTDKQTVVQITTTPEAIVVESLPPKPLPPKAASPKPKTKNRP